MAAMIANRGVAKPLSVLNDQTGLSNVPQDSPIYGPDTADRLMDVMRSTVNSGTATHAFAKGRYRSIARDVAGKTGTLTGRTPAGLTSLFIGFYPVSKPKIAVSSVVVLEDRYNFKAPQLAAEAILAWKDQQARLRNAHH